MSHFESHSLKEMPAVLILSEKLVTTSVITKRSSIRIIPPSLLLYAIALLMYIPGTRKTMACRRAFLIFR